MAKISTSYESADGKKFATELEADAHDLSLSLAGSIKAFVTVTKLGKAEATRAAKYVAQYTAFMVTYVQPEAAANDSEAAQAA